jgi:hypothetical protein
VLAHSLAGFPGGERVGSTPGVLPGSVTPGGFFRGLALGGLRAPQGGVQLPGQVTGLRPQVTGLVVGGFGAGLRGGAAAFGGLGLMPRAADAEPYRIQ